ncbi:DUF6907 domain-containing protein [Streptomyces sp. NPDC057575]|uniref:DUF6907 domain-containing protein n=1 Tax=unclassified Streptomyces TaxID=2593676 RepID=UPI003674BC8C
MTVLHDVPVVSASIPSPAVPAVSHPTVCPSWCKNRSQPLAHDFGPSMTDHWSPEYLLTGPRPSSGEFPVLLHAELSRIDEGDSADQTVLYVQGETSVDLKADEADIFIAQAQAFVDTLRVLRRQMG